ncbi:hypothetical protein BS636_11220 [Acinetobacter sp. LoGeW2-3]|uniref:hypothetical protein n=1 Tax=Acinetobacter sp. LoGeW2-3 TaxID=1808001 RepID=UPI000C05C69B|nr:hypothetical protein [Acinetobacter sp. LoGeW2-3]ATO20190.1 hypothetical protein BS636_11220 [Acinetobacter sp. LoGeW2-3]
MNDLEIQHPSLILIKEHAQSLKKILKLTQEAFNICHEDLAIANSATLCNCLVLISVQYGFNDFGALTSFVKKTAVIKPSNNIDSKILYRLSRIYKLPIEHLFIKASFKTLKDYFKKSNLPSFICLDSDSQKSSFLLTMRYLQINKWDPVLKPLIVNPDFRSSDHDIYEYSYIDRLIRVNILNQLLSHARVCIKNVIYSEISLPISHFFGNNINRNVFLTDIAEFFNDLSIGSNLYYVKLLNLLPNIERNSHLYNEVNTQELNIYSYSGSDNISSLKINFSIGPRLYAMLTEFKKREECPKLNIEYDLVSHKTQTAIDNAINLEDTTKNLSKNIIEQLISNLHHLNPVITGSLSDWYQAEPKESMSNLLWREFTIPYAHHALTLAKECIKQSDQFLILRATECYFDKNGLLMINREQRFKFYSNDPLAALGDNYYEISLFVNLYIAFHLITKIDLNSPDKIYFRLMINYITSIYPSHLPIPKKPKLNIFGTYS